MNIESGYYPPGAEFDPNAPYNERSLPEKEIEVTISVTLSKTVKIHVDDYIPTKEYIDDEGYMESIDFSECDLKSAVEEQIILPQHAASFLTVNTKATKKAFKDLKDWNVDDFEVVMEN